VSPTSSPPTLALQLAVAGLTKMLKGIQVLDLTRVLAGPYCSMLLGDMGAQVIKVESITGDDTRKWGPPCLKGESAYYLGVNRNKKSIAVNLKSLDGQQVVKKIAQKADVLIENFIPGKMSEFNLGYETLNKINSKLIYASITGYGPTGPFAKKPGYDVIIEAEGGLMHITGEDNRPPVKVGVAITDLTTGLYAHGAILAALFERTKSGQGQKIDVSLLECQVANLANIGHNYLLGGMEAQRLGTEHASIVPYQV
jgi:succinate--hydroxymethylglutarate CoA-transferase